MALDIYIYLKGGRGDGFVPGWNGSVEEEGTLILNEADELVPDGKGLEHSEPYRDIFQQGGQKFWNSQSVGEGRVENSSIDDRYRYNLPPGNVYYATGVEQEAWVSGSVGGAPITATLETSASDDIAHTKPRQFTRVATWLIFGSTLGDAFKFKFRKADVIGWGGRARTD